MSDATQVSVSEQAPDGQDPVGHDDAETRVVPSALAAFAAAAAAAREAMDNNGAYSATEGVAAVRDVVFALLPMVKHLSPYVGDYTDSGARAMERAHAALTSVFAESSDAHRLVSVSEAAADAGRP